MMSMIRRNSGTFLGASMTIGGGRGAIGADGGGLGLSARTHGSAASFAQTMRSHFATSKRHHGKFVESLAEQQQHKGAPEEPPPPPKHESSSDSNSDKEPENDGEIDGERLRMNEERARLDDEEQADMAWYFRNRSTELDVCLRHESIYLFDDTSKFRLFLYNISRHWVFETIVIMTILLNCIILALDDPTVEVEPPWVQGFNIFFVVVFTLEMIWKIVAYGFVLHEGAYLRNNWNILDGIIVCLSYLQFIGGVGQLSFVRAVRVLRPLRSMNAIPELKSLVAVMLDSLRGLANVLLLTLFFFGIFGIFGVQLFRGSLQQQCTPIVNFTQNATLLALCSDYRHLNESIRNSSSSGPLVAFVSSPDQREFLNRTCAAIAAFVAPDPLPEPFICNPTSAPGTTANGLPCPPGFACTNHNRNPNLGKSSFDNFFWTLLLIIQILTFEAWSEQMYNVMAATGPAAAVYFVLLIIVGGYMLLNLALAIISFEFQENRAQLNARQQMEQKTVTLLDDTKAFAHDAAESRGLTSAALAQAAEAAATAAADQQHRDSSAHPPARPRRKNNNNNNEADDYDEDEDYEENDDLQELRNQVMQHILGPNSNDGSGEEHNNNNSQGGNGTIKNNNNNMNPLSKTTAARRTQQQQEHRGGAAAAAIGARRKGGGDGDRNGAAEQEMSTTSSGARNNNNRSHVGRSVTILPHVERNGRRPFSGGSAGAVTTDSEDKEEEDDDDDTDEETHTSLATHQQPKSFADRWDDAREFVFAVVEGDRDLYAREVIQTTYFAQFIIFCIFLNTVVLAADHYGASPTQEQVSNVMNYVFTSFFTVEIVLKIFCLGPWLFLQAGFNVFDFIVVVVSLVELGLGSENSQFSVFRAFRLLRVLKLLKKFPALLQIVNIIGRAVKDTAAMNVLVLLYLFIASLFGMSFFGGKRMTNPGEREIRSSFDNFGWAFLTVFQILTRDDWPNLMWHAMRATSDWAAFFFLCCVLFGDLVILNLFMSIVIGTFESEYKEKELLLKDAKRDPRRRLLAITNGVAGIKNPTHIDYVQTLTAGLTGTFSGPQRDATAVDAATFRQLGVGKATRDFIMIDDPVQLPEVKRIIRRKAAASAAGDNDNSDDDDGADIITNNKKSSAPAADAAAAQQKTTNSKNSKLNNTSTQQEVISERSREFKNNANASGAFAPAHEGGEIGFLEPNAGDQLVVRTDRGASVDEMMFGKQTDPVSRLRSIFGKNKFSDIVRAAQAQAENTIGKAVLAMCPKCKDPIFEPWNLDSYYFQSLSPIAMHEKICDRIQVRKARTKVLARLMHYVEEKEPCRPTPYPHEVEEIFGTAWEVGLLLGEDLGLHLAAPSWRKLFAALEEESQVLRLRVGEDYIGGAVVTYTAANTPTEMKTNGGDALWIFGQHNQIRVLLTNLVVNPWFENFIIFCIAASSVILAFDSPRTPSDALTVIGDVFSAIFVFECAAKITAFGFFLHRGSYLRDWWNVLDFLIVVVAVLSWAIGDQVDISFLRVFRTFRALRPLRVINRNQGLKMVVLTLLESLKGIFNVALITLLIWFIFAILGTQLFGGALYFCTDPSIGVRGNCTGLFVRNVTNFNSSGFEFVVNSSIQERKWKTYDYNFDNTYNSFLLLFSVATLDAWSERMFWVIDSQGPELGPRRNSQPWMAVYFLLFIVIGSFFLLSMFVGVVISQYSRTKDRLDCPWPVLNEEQKHWIETQRMVLNFRPVPRRMPPVDPKILEGAKKVAADSVDLTGLVEKGIVSTRTLWQVAAARHAVRELNLRPLTRWESLRVAMFELVESVHFEIATGLVVLGSITLIAVEHEGMSKEFEVGLRWANVAFTVLFGIEMLCKWVGLGLAQYFWDPWNGFDCFLVVVGAIADAELQDFGINLNLLRILRVFRTMRLLALVRRAKRVRILLETMWFSLPALGNVSMFLLLVFFIYSVLGVQLFTFVLPNDDGEGLDDKYSNFENFATAFLMLVRVATMDDWASVMADVSRTTDCGPYEWKANETADSCGNPVAAPFFFFSFIIIAVFVLVNILVAIILDNFNTAQKIDHSDVRLQDLKKFAVEWTKYDPEATMLMPTRHFWKLIAELKPPLGIARRATRSALLKLLHWELWIPEHEGYIHFIEALVPLARRTHVDAEFTEDQIREHEIYWRQEVPQLVELPVQRLHQKRIGVQHYFAQTFIAAVMRRIAARQEVEKRFRDKYREIEKWYERNGTPHVRRVALDRLKERSEQRERAQEAYKEKVRNSARGASFDFGGHPSSAAGSESRKSRRKHFAKLRRGNKKLVGSHDDGEDDEEEEEEDEDDDTNSSPKLKSAGSSPSRSGSRKLSNAGNSSSHSYNNDSPSGTVASIPMLSIHTTNSVLFPANSAGREEDEEE